MAPTTGLTPLQVAALGVFVERPMHPYEAYTLLANRRTDLVVKLKPGTMYHAIGRLADIGHLTMVGTDRAGNRPERTIYAVTDSGRTAFGEAIEDLVARPRHEYPSFPLGLSELHNLPAPRANQLLQQRISAQADLRDAFLAALDDCDERGIPRVYLLEVEYAVSQLTAEIAWLTELIDRIATASLPWHRHPADQVCHEADELTTTELTALPLPDRRLAPARPLIDGSPA